MTTVFPETITTIPGRETASVITCNGAYSIKGGLLDNLRIVDFRYTRFALDPRTGLFAMVRCVTSYPSPLAMQAYLPEIGWILSGPL